MVLAYPDCPLLGISGPITALLAGLLLSGLGWVTLNLLLIPVAMVPLAVLVWQ